VVSGLRFDSPRVNGLEALVAVYRRERGFTLIELMIVVMIIGIIAAIAIPNLILAVERAKQKRTMADMRSLATAWESRSVETGRYNASGAMVVGVDQMVDINDLGTALQPTYIRTMPKTDGWGHPLEAYTSLAWGSATNAGAYALISPGRDGRFATQPTTGATTNFDCDIVYSNGSFIAYPEGANSSRQ
jgi:type II secretion system protein G